MSEKRWALLIGIDSVRVPARAAAAPRVRQRHDGVDGRADERVVRLRLPAHRNHAADERRATREGILAAFDELVEKAGPDDVVFVHYSGHGSQMREAIPGSEPDGLDETIVPGDARGRTTPTRKDITDNELNRLLWSLTAKTPRVTMVFDSCHSASITRDVFVAPVRGIDADLRPRRRTEVERAARVVVPSPRSATHRARGLPRGRGVPRATGGAEARRAHVVPDPRAHGRARGRDVSRRVRGGGGAG